MLPIPALRDHLKLGPERESELEALRDMVLAMWEQVTGRPWTRKVGHVETIVRELDQQTLVDLSLLPIETITKVEERVDPAVATWTTVAATEYELFYGRALERLTGYWAKRVRVTYTGGYATEPTGLQQACPPDVLRALLTQAQFTLQRLTGDRVALKSQAFEAGSTSFEKADFHPLFASIAWQRRRKA